MYHTDIREKTLANSNFRQVLYTGPNSQLVVMSLKAGEDIGEEVHGDVDQHLIILEGEGEAVVDGATQPLTRDSVVVVPAGARHNIINTGSGILQLFTIYAPPEHPDGTVHRTRAEAMESEDHQ